MGNANAFYQGAKWYDDYQDQARQAKADAWTQEQQGRTRKDWETQDNTRAGLASMIDNVGTSTAGELADPRAILGLGDAIPEPTAYAQRQGFEAPVGADVKTPGLASMAPRPSPFFDAQTKMHQQKLAMAKAVGGERGATLALDTGDLMRKSKLAEESTQIAETIQNLRPQDYQKLMETVTADSGNTYEATVDPETGITTLKLGDSKAQLTRAQAGQYFAAKHRLKEGDPTAPADLEKIDAGLAAKVMAEYKSLRDTANDSNKATYQNATIDVREKGLEQRERLGLSGIRNPEIQAAKTKLDEAKNKRLDIQARINQTHQRFSLGLIKKDAATAKLAELEKQQIQYDKIIDAGEVSQPGLGTPIAPSEKAMREQASSDIGGTPEAADREIAATMEAINNPKTNPQDRQNAIAYLADLRRQKGNMGLANQSIQPAPTKPGIARPTNAAEHAALPKGAKYMAPNGQLYVKQ